MVIFLAGAVPLAFSIVAFGYSKSAVSVAELGQRAARGFFSFIISFLIYLLLRPAVQLEYTFAGLYRYYLAHHNLYFAVWCVVTYLVYYKVPHTDTPEAESTLILAYFTAFYTLLAVGEILLNIKEITGYILFLLPLSRIGVILISVAALLFARRMYIVARYGLLLVPFAASAVAAFVPVLYTLRHVTGSVLLCVALFAIGGFLYVLADRK